MVVAEIAPHASGEWSGQLREEDSGQVLGERWSAQSRSELIEKIRYWVPLSHLNFRDVYDPLEP
jgi:hypothetical protein